MAAWVAVAVLTAVLAGAVGRSNVTAYGLPGTDSQRAQNLLKQDFKTPERRRRRGRMSCLERDDRLAGGARSDHADACTGKALPHVAAAVSPYSPRRLGQVSANRMTAFAKVNYDRQASRLCGFARSYGFDLLIAVGAIESALEVALRHDAARRLDTTLGSRCRLSRPSS